MSAPQIVLGDHPMLEALQHKQDHDGEVILAAVTRLGNSVQFIFSPELLQTDDANIDKLIACFGDWLRKARATPLDDFGRVP